MELALPLDSYNGCINESDGVEGDCASKLDALVALLFDDPVPESHGSRKCVPLV